MLTISDAEPCVSRDIALVEHIKNKTILSMKYLFGICNDTFGRKYLHYSDYLDSTLQNERCNGLLFAIHDRLHKLIKEDKINEVEWLLNNVDLSHCICKKIDIIPIYSDKFDKYENEIIYITAQMSHVNLYNKQYDCKRPSYEKFSKSKEAIKVALTHLKSLDLACYKEFLALISDIVICDSDVINAGTCFDTFGFLYVRQLNDDETWLKYFEHIVHEAGHHHLYTVLAKDLLIKSTKNGQYYYSPLRQEKRPLNGVYQAMFVLARTIRAFNRMKANKAYDKWIPQIRTHYNNAKNESSFEDKFLSTYEVIQNHADLTIVGKKLLDSCYKLACV